MVIFYVNLKKSLFRSYPLGCCPNIIQTLRGMKNQLRFYNVAMEFFSCHANSYAVAYAKTRLLLFFLTGVGTP